MNELILLFTGGLGAMLTFIVAHDLKQGVVRASAGLSLIVGLFFYVFPNLVSPILTVEIPVLFFGGSFVGMMSKDRVTSNLLIFLGGALFSGIYLLSSEIFIGFGGKLGATAGIASFIVFGIAVLIKRFKVM